MWNYQTRLVRFTSYFSQWLLSYEMWSSLPQQRRQWYRSESPKMYPLRSNEYGKVTKCLSTAPGLIGSFRSPGRPRFPLTIFYHLLYNMSITYLHQRYTYRFTRSRHRAVNHPPRKACKPIFYSVPHPSLDLHSLRSVRQNDLPPAAHFSSVTSFLWSRSRIVSTCHHHSNKSTAWTRTVYVTTIHKQN